jgi:hypothetical protein
LKCDTKVDDGTAQLLLFSLFRKYKYKQYRQSLIDKLESLHVENLKLYWNIVNELQGKSEKSGSSTLKFSCRVIGPNKIW